ncbi:MAG: GspH/FimT family pseudopilin [Methylobacillus sp.]|nr:GspH/FimT family pseudopilin [Methylobacillus sp.]
MSYISTIVWQRPFSTTRGFTMIELMVALVILVVLAAIAIPAFGNFVKNTRIYTVSSEIQTTLSYTRSEAITRRVPVSVCPSIDETSCSSKWENLGGHTGANVGLLVFIDSGTAGTRDGADQVLKYIQITDPNLEITASNDFSSSDPVKAYVQYKSSGQSDLAFTSTLLICDDRKESYRSGDYGRLITAYMTGRTEILADQHCS